VAEVLPAEPLELASLTALQVIELCPDVAGEINLHGHSFR
jgi:hypothetical protein